MAHNHGMAEWRIKGTYLEFCNCAQSEKFSIDLPEMKWDLSERHTVFSTFDYTNA